MPSPGAQSSVAVVHVGVVLRQMVAPSAFSRVRLSCMWKKSEVSAERDSQLRDIVRNNRCLTVC